MSKAFDDLIHSLDEDDMSVLKGFILNTVRAEKDDDQDPLEEPPAQDIIQVMATGTLEALRAFAQVLAEEQG